MAGPLRKLETAAQVYREQGFQGVWTVVRSKLGMAPRPPSPLGFDDIAAIVRNELHRSEARFRALANGVEYAYGTAVPGDIAEFGTMTGRSATAIAVAMRHLNGQYSAALHGTKRAWFFDSFEGLPETSSEVDRRSPHVLSGAWARGTCNGLSEAEFSALMAIYLPAQDFRVIKGWYKDTLATIPKDQKFALVHIDSDLYESAIDVLDTLFAAGMVSNGATIFFDDWDCNAASPDLGERRAWREVCERYKISYSDCGSYSFASHRVIVHCYGSSPGNR